MTKLISRTALTLSASALVLAAAPASAAVVITIEEVGSNVVATTSGTLNLTGLNQIAQQSLPAQINASKGNFLAGSGVYSLYDIGSAVPFGTGGMFFGSGSGDLFAIANSGSLGTGVVGVSANYVSGSSISATTTFVNASFASLGLETGVYFNNLQNDTVLVNVGAVPEPGTWALMLLGFLGIGMAMRKERQHHKISVAYS